MPLKIADSRTLAGAAEDWPILFSVLAALSYRGRLQEIVRSYSKRSHEVDTVVQDLTLKGD